MMANELLLTLPFRVSSSFRPTGQIIFSSPWNAPILFGLQGINSTNDIREILIGYEWPIPLFHLHTQLKKHELENIHLQRFFDDWRTSTGSPFCLSVKIGNNPPDFELLQLNERTSRLDLAQFTSENRRKAHARFEKIKNFIFESDQTKLTHLQGFVVYFWWLDAENDGDPISTQSAREDIFDALRAYIPRPTKIEGERLPREHPGLHIGRAASGAAFYAHPIEGGAPNTDFFKKTGFELGLATSSQTSETQAWHEIDRLISKHDKPEIDELLITTGAPNNQGYVYLSDDQLMRFALSNPRTLETPKYIRKIFVHLWHGALVYRLFPSQ